MDKPKYLDFDLQIDEITPSTFHAHVLKSPVGGRAESLFDFPLSSLELDNFFLRVGRTRHATRGLGSPEINAARNVGGKLYNAVFTEQLRKCLLKSRVKAEKQKLGLRIRLRLPPSLIELPWEYLYIPDEDHFISHSTKISVVRFLDLPQLTRKLTVDPPLKILVMISNPSSGTYQSLDVESEWNKIEQSVSSLSHLFQLKRLSGATIRSLRQELRREQYHVFHFVGHGGFDPQTQDGILILEDEARSDNKLSGTRLGALLNNYPSLKMVLLNACEGGRTTQNDPFAGVAQQLLRQGVPLVIAMQFRISDDAAINLTQEFYDVLAVEYSVERALAEARLAIFLDNNDIEWGTPVLYMRALNSELFESHSLASYVDPNALQVLNQIETEIRQREAIELNKQNLVRNSLVNSLKSTSEQPPIDFSWILIPDDISTTESRNKHDELINNGFTVQSFRISRVPVTVAQFRDFINSTGYVTQAEKDRYANIFVDQGWRKVENAYWAKPKGSDVNSGNIDQHPVTCVSYWDAEAFCQWAGVRLPTEAEWEKAARGPKGKIYPWGDFEPDDTLCNFDNNVGETTPVKNYPAGSSDYGVLDMVGNVWEWTSSMATEDDMEAMEPDELGQKPIHAWVTRGGSYIVEQKLVQCTTRDLQAPNKNWGDLGFRVVNV